MGKALDPLRRVGNTEETAGAREALYTRQELPTTATLCTRDSALKGAHHKYSGISIFSLFVNKMILQPQIIVDQGRHSTSLCNAKPRSNKLWPVQNNFSEKTNKEKYQTPFHLFSMKTAMVSPLPSPTDRK